MLYVIQVLLTACSQAVSKPVWHIPLLRLQWKTPDDGQRNCLKHVEFFTVHTAMLYVIQVLLTACSQAFNKPVWHIPLLRLQWKTPDDGQRNYAKHVGFYSKNKFEKLVHLVGFIIRIFHDARSPERHIRTEYFSCVCVYIYFLV